MTVRRDGHRVTVTGVFLDEELDADFQDLMFRYTIESGKINKIIK